MYVCYVCMPGFFLGSLAMFTGHAQWPCSLVMLTGHVRLVLLLLNLRLERWEIVRGEAHDLVEEAQALLATLPAFLPLALLAIPGGDQSRKLVRVRLVLQAGPAHHWRAGVI